MQYILAVIVFAAYGVQRFAKSGNTFSQPSETRIFITQRFFNLFLDKKLKLGYHTKKANQTVKIQKNSGDFSCTSSDSTLGIPGIPQNNPRVIRSQKLLCRSGDI